MLDVGLVWFCLARGHEGMNGEERLTFKGLAFIPHLNQSQPGEA